MEYDSTADRESLARRLRDLRDLALDEAYAASNGREHKAWADSVKTWVSLLALIDAGDDIENVRRLLDKIGGVA